MGMEMKTGRAENLPYSLSRWTDICAGDKWAWFEQQIDQGYMVAFDPRSAFPYRWSLQPADVLGLVFWTKNPEPLAKWAKLNRQRYSMRAHVTITGWHEVEWKVPPLSEVLFHTRQLADALGPDRVVWRFSPVPMIPDEQVVARFEQIAQGLEWHVNKVYVSFLQENDRMPEKRSPEQRAKLMIRLSAIAKRYGIVMQVCREESTPLPGPTQHNGLTTYVTHGVCEDGSMFAPVTEPVKEGCGCAICVEPFTINEACTYGCQYCYSADESLSPLKRDTTKRLPLLNHGRA